MTRDALRSTRCAMLLGLALATPACLEDVALISEARAIVLAKQVFANHGIAATDPRHVVSDIHACDGGTPETCETVTFTLDGWDPARRVGFEYVADNDTDFGRGTRWSDIGTSDRLQSAVDAALAATGERVLIIRQWGHETIELAEDTFVRSLDERLDALGL